MQGGERERERSGVHVFEGDCIANESAAARALNVQHTGVEVSARVSAWVFI